MPALRSLFVIVLLLSSAAAPAANNPAAELVHLLDYIGVDYPGTVAEGRIVNPDEYAEMVEFGQRVIELAQQLPDSEDKIHLLQDARRLQAAINKRAKGQEIARLTAAMQQQAIRLGGISTTPRQPPSLSLGRTLYETHCTSCHGAEGRGDGPAAAGLSPAPSNFHDRERQFKRSLYGLYNTISLGVSGTAMRGYPELPEADRWALAFYVGSLPFDDDEVRAGQRLAKEGAARELIPDLTRLVNLTPAEMQEHHGEQGLAVLAYLRHHPEELAGGENAIAHARELLQQSVAAYVQGETRTAYELAIAAYLDGFETAEAGLRNLDPELVAEVERAMAAFRTATRSGAPRARVEAAADEVDALLRRAQQMLANTTLTPTVTFVSSLVIVLREGLEALLVLAAIIALLIKAERRDALPWVHAGWISALALGGVTWWVSRYLLDISGANREVTEGLTALLATAILLYVGFWLHSKSHARSWQKFLKEKIHDALQGRALFALTGVAFLAVYREVFETVLFYEALAQQTDPLAGMQMLWFGLFTGIGGLAVLGWLLLRTGLRLPLRLFFNVNAFLLFALAVIFTGQGIAALQEAGYIDIHPLNLPRFDWIGFYPTLQTVLGQLLVLTLIGGLFWWERRRNRKDTA